MADTADQKAAETIARGIEGRVFRLNAERDELLKATGRIAEIDAEIAALAPELARVQSRRPPRPAKPVREDIAPGGTVRTPKE